MLSFFLLAAGMAEALLVPMPEAKDVQRTPPIELMAFTVALPCPDSGEVLHFYKPRLEAQGYRLCGSTEVQWTTSPTVTGETRSYQSIFVNDGTRTAVLVAASCSLNNGRTTATDQSVSLTLLHERSKPEVERTYKVSCGK